MTTLHPDQPTCRFLHRWLAARVGQPLRAWSSNSGDGAEARSFAAMCDEYGVDAEVVATDADPARVAAAARHGFAGSATVHYVVHDATRPFTDHGTFDVVLVRSVPVDPVRIQNAADRLRPDGLLVLADRANCDAFDGLLERVHESVFRRSALVHP